MNVSEPASIVARIAHHDLPGVFLEQRVQAVDERPAEPAGHLLVEDHGVALRDRLPQRRQDRRIGVVAAFVEEPEVESWLLSVLAVALAVRHGVEAPRLDDHRRRIHAEAAQLPQELPAEDVLADDTDRPYVSRPERRHVGDDVGRPAERVIVPADRLGPEASLGGKPRRREDSGSNRRPGRSPRRPPHSPARSFRGCPGRGSRASGLPGASACGHHCPSAGPRPGPARPTGRDVG